MFRTIQPALTRVNRPVAQTARNLIFATGFLFGAASASAIPCPGWFLYHTTCGQPQDPPPSCDSPGGGGPSDGPITLPGGPPGPWTPASLCGSCSGASGPGMPYYWISEPRLQLRLQDYPLGTYSPGLGPSPVYFLSYRNKGGTPEEDGYFSWGTNWSCSLRAYVLDPGDGTVRMHRGGAGFVDYTVGVPHSRDAAVMQITSPNVSYELDMPDGSKKIFQDAYTNADNDILLFISQQIDPQGNAVTYHYSTSGGVFRLTSVTDADGNSTHLYYENGSFPNRVTKVVDPFLRTNLLAYNERGYLTNTTDAQGLPSSFLYDADVSVPHTGWITNLTTPYGTTSFTFGGSEPDSDGYGNGGYTINRYILVTLPNGGKELYAYRADCFDFISNITPPSTSPFGNTLDDVDQYYRNSFYWSPLQYSRLTTTDPASFQVADYGIGRLRHWLSDLSGQPAPVLSLERAPSPDGSTPGQFTWHDYPDKTSGNNHIGSSDLPSLKALALPDGTTRFDRTIRNSFGWITNDVATYTGTGGSVQLRTNLFTYYSDIDLLLQIGPNQEQVVSNYFSSHTYHQPDASSDALNQTTTYLYNAKRQLIRTVSPAGLTTTNVYVPSGTDVNRLTNIIDIEISRTNSYTYTNALVYTHTDPRGLVTTNVYDNLSRLTNSSDSRGTTKYYYDKIDLVRVVDRMGFTNSFAFDAVRRMIGKTNALGYATAYSYCTCGALNYMLDSEGGYTRYFYDFAGRMTNAVYADNFSVTNWFNTLGQITNTIDRSGYSLTNWFNNQGLQFAVSTAAGNQEYKDFDNEDRATNVVNSEGVSIAMAYDALGRLRTRKYPDNGVESYGYSARGIIAYTNQIGMTNFFVYDAGGRKTFETNANHELIRYTNNAASDLLSLTDGKGQTTRWKYDEYGRVTNKLDQASTAILRYKYDADNRLTNRWSAAKGDTYYSYDSVGNLLTINYPLSGTINFSFDALKRMTNMADAIGTTKYTYTAAGQLLTEDGPFASDTVTNVYSNRLRTGLGLQQPTGAWTNGFAYDSVKRLTNVTSPAGTFGYLYDPTLFTHHPSLLTLPNTSYITNAFDADARLIATYLKNSGNTVLDSYTYIYNPANQRTNLTRTDASTVAFKYDPIGQLKVADSSVNAEDRGYFYDAAWNMIQQTMNGSPTTYSVDQKNQVYLYSPYTNTFDANGNITRRDYAVGLYNVLQYTYDDENRLVSILSDYGDPSLWWETDFVYDGLGRMRARTEYSYADSSWLHTNAFSYIYDGWRVIQERNYSDNSPLVSYTRGNDLSGSMEGAGGIGGLLARSSGATHSYYFADGNGNITYMLNSSQAMVAKYRYDPFGNTISSSGTLASDNVYRFSSKEIHANSGMYYYGFRFYNPNLQRWINRDPIEELGGCNLYAFAGNEPVENYDTLGLSCATDIGKCVSATVSAALVCKGGNKWACRAAALAAAAACAAAWDSCDPHINIPWPTLPPGDPPPYPIDKNRPPTAICGPPLPPQPSPPPTIGPPPTPGPWPPSAPPVLNWPVNRTVLFNDLMSIPHP